MAKATVATLQAVWDCRWSRSGHRITGVSEALQPEGAWVCVRNGDRRPVTERECSRCAQWEFLPTVLTTDVIHPSRAMLLRPSPAVSGRRMTFTAVDVQLVATKAILILIAAGFTSVGFALLTAVIWIPVTIALWMVAAVLVGLAAGWQVSRED